MQYDDDVSLLPTSLGEGRGEVKLPASLLEAGENPDILKGIQALFQSVVQALALSSDSRGRWVHQEEDVSLKQSAGPEWPVTRCSGVLKRRTQGKTQ